MRRTILSIAGFVLLGLMVSTGGSLQAAPPIQDTLPTPTPGPTTPRIMLVMDVSGSMTEFVLPENAPAELTELRNRINGILNDPEYIRVNSAREALENDPTQLALGEALDRTKEAYENWLAANNVDPDKLVEELKQLFIASGCKDTYAYRIVHFNNNMAEVDSSIDTGCRDFLNNKNIRGNDKT